MTLLQRTALLCVLGCTTFAVASDVPKAVLPDNVILCAPASGCLNKTLFGRSYKVLTTPRFTVMVSVSNQGIYTRADISITNSSPYNLNLSPEDFRVEIQNQKKTRVLLYVAPADLKDVPPPPPIPSVETASTDTAPAPAAAPVPELKTVSLTEGATDSKSPDIDGLYLAAKKKAALQEAIDKATAQRDLPAATIAPNEVTRGRVFFEHDKRAKEVNIVLPIAGLVFEFPYTLGR